MDTLPAPLREVVEQLSGLPGVGRKSALRMALALLNMPREKAEAFGRSVLDLRSRLCVCSRCGGLADADPCHLCSDPSRDDSHLCLVAEWDSLLALEEMGVYRGRYLILGGLVSPLDGCRPGSLCFDLLRTRLASGEVAELILALGATVDAETTASYVKNLIGDAFPAVTVSRLAQGIPIGGEVKYMDKETLKQSLTHRQKI